MNQRLNLEEDEVYGKTKSKENTELIQIMKFFNKLASKLAVAIRNSLKLNGYINIKRSWPAPMDGIYSFLMDIIIHNL